MIAREWTRIGCIGFGGPPTHIALLRRLCVETRGWLPAREFEDGVVATNLVPGPASTQLAIFCAWRLRGTPGALVGGLGFILPGLVVILALAAVFLASDPPAWILGAAAGAGAAVPAVALRTATTLIPASWSRIRGDGWARIRWFGYAVLGGVGAAAFGPYLVVVLVGCGLVEVSVGATAGPHTTSVRAVVPVAVAHAVSLGGLGALVWVAFKVGALSYGGGFVIVPLMQHDAVTTYQWMTGPQFLDAVALGQLTPGPVVQTVAVVGYAAAGIGGGLLAAFVAFAPSFLFVLVGGPRFDRLRASQVIRSFLSGAGPAVIGAIAGSSIPLALALQHSWQLALLAGALVWLFVVRRGVVSALVLAGALGIAATFLGMPAY